MTAADDRPDLRDAVPSRGSRRVVSDLVLGARLSVGGGRASWIRLVLMAFAVGMCVTLLLIGASIGRAGDSRSARADLIQPRTIEDIGRSSYPSEEARGSAISAARSAVQWQIHRSMVNSGGYQVIGVDMAALSANPSLPQGVSTLPDPGQLVVSPDLAALLGSSAGDGLRPRLSQPIVGIIGDEGLIHPHELRFYRGIGRSSDELNISELAIGWGGPLPIVPSIESLSAVDRTIIVTGIAILIVPLMVFIAISSRIGGPARSRRLAAIRLVGASRQQIRRFAFVEAILSGLLGLVVGTCGYLIARLFAPSMSVSGAGYFVGDVQPNPVLALLTLVLVPVLAMGSVMLGQRLVLVDPLGIRRTGLAPRRRLWWRLAVVAVATGALILVNRTAPNYQDGFPDSNASFAFIPGVALAMICIPVLAPYLIERLAGVVPKSGTGWQLATRRLQHDSGTASRVVSGIAVVLCAAVAILPLLSYVGARVGENTGGSPARQGTGYLLVGAPIRAIEPIRDAISSVPGVGGTTATAQVIISGESNTGSMNIADCATIQQISTIPDCRDGDAITVQSGSDDPAPRPGAHLRVSASNGQPTNQTFEVSLPTTIKSTSLKPMMFPGGLYLTPGALTGTAAGLLDQTNSIEILVDTAALDDAGFDRVRNVLAQFGWRVDDSQFGVGAQLTHLGQLMMTARAGLLVGGALVLLVAILSMLALSVEQIVERRRPLTMAVASGVPRSVLARSSIYTVLAPAAVAILLADLIGTLVSLAFGPYLRAAITIDPLEMAGLSLATLAIIALITAATLPALRRLTGPDALRTE